MAEQTAIEWTDATWNPVRGCTRLSPGCGGPGKAGGCYAEKIAARFSDPGQPFHGFAERRNGEARWTGKLALIEDKLTIPLRWKKPRRIFVNSMSDLFHENLPDEAIDRVFTVMALCPQHTFQVLTKRAERMRKYVTALVAAERPIASIATELRGSVIGGIQALSAFFDHDRDDRGPIKNVWLGVSAERQQEADERIPLLLQTPAATRFVSLEPLLGPIDLTAIEAPDKVEGERWTFNALTSGDYYEQWSETCLGEPRRSGGDGPNREHGLDWVIVGGESGSNTRPMHPDWARSLRDQCAAAGVAFFFKQWGEWTSETVEGTEVDVSALPKNQAVWFGDGKTNHILSTRIGKKRAGRLLDGVEHNAFPEARS